MLALHERDEMLADLAAEVPTQGRICRAGQIPDSNNDIRQRDVFDATPSFSTMTTSSTRIGCVSAIWKPASNVAMLRWAASPTTMPAMPADARMLAPNCRTDSKTTPLTC